MNFVRNEGKDKGEICWRAEIQIDKDVIVYNIHNFKYGYRDGENYKTVFVARDSLYVSILSKTREGLDKFEEELITAFRNKVISDITKHNKVIKNENVRIAYKNTILHSNIFRKYKIDELLD